MYPQKCINSVCNWLVIDNCDGKSGTEFCKHFKFDMGNIHSITIDAIWGEIKCRSPHLILTLSSISFVYRIEYLESETDNINRRTLASLSIMWFDLVLKANKNIDAELLRQSKIGTHYRVSARTTNINEQKEFEK